MKKRIHELVQDNKSHMIEAIKDLIAIESIHGRQHENEKALDYVLDLARSFGFKTMISTKKDVGIVEYGTGQECFGILVHVDVVAVGDLSKWQSPPFECQLKDDYLVGRGAIDDKGPTIMSLFALKILKDLKCEPSFKLWLIIGTCEEGHWSDMETFKNEFPMPSLGFSPDGKFPIYNIEKGYADVELTFNEPALKQLLYLNAGESTNSIPSIATYQLLGNEQRIFNGKSAHSSRPEKGENAILKLAEALVEEETFKFSQFLVNYFKEDGFATRLGLDDSSGIYKGEACGRTTCVPTVINLVDSKVILNLNIRQQFGTTQNNIEQAFEKIKDDYGFTYCVKEFLEASMVSRTLPHLKLMQEVYQSYGLEGDFEVASGTSYAKAMPNFVSWGPVFPNEPDCAHQENERLSLKTMILGTQLYVYYLSLL
jgi:succinyl-diaminopimelate desuccinylase